MAGIEKPGRGRDAVGVGMSVPRSKDGTLRDNVGKATDSVGSATAGRDIDGMTRVVKGASGFTVESAARFDDNPFNTKVQVLAMV